MEAFKRKQSLWTAFFIFFIDNIGFTIALPVLPILFLSSDLSFIEGAGSVATRTVYYAITCAAFPLAQFFGGPLIGDFADKQGRKFAFCLSIALTTIGYFFSSFAVWLSNFPLLVLSRLLTGFFAGNSAVCLATVSDLSETEQSRSKNFGYISMLGGVSFVCSVLIADFFSDVSYSSSFSLAIPFLITGVISLLSLPIVLVFFHETFLSKSIKKFRFFALLKDVILAFVDKEVCLVVVFGFFWFNSWVVNLLWFVPYMINGLKIDALVMTYVLVGVGVIWSFSGGVINKLLGKYMSSIQVVFYGSLLMMVTFALTAIFHNLVAYVLFLYFLMLVGSSTWANVNNVLSMSVTSEKQGKIMGIGQSLAAIAKVMAPFTGALIFNICNSFVFLLSAALMGIALTLLVFIKKGFKSRST